MYKRIQTCSPDKVERSVTAKNLYILIKGDDNHNGSYKVAVQELKPSSSLGRDWPRQLKIKVQSELNMYDANVPYNLQFEPHCPGYYDDDDNDGIINGLDDTNDKDIYGTKHRTNHRRLGTYEEHRSKLCPRLRMDLGCGEFVL